MKKTLIRVYFTFNFNSYDYKVKEMYNIDPIV